MLQTFYDLFNYCAVMYLICDLFFLLMEKESYLRQLFLESIASRFFVTTEYSCVTVVP